MSFPTLKTLKSTQKKIRMLGFRVKGSPSIAVAEVTNITAIADLGVKELSTITAGADVAGSLNSTYFTFSLLNTAGVATNFYVWFNVNSAGVDPAVASATGIAVALATGATASTVGGAIRTALGANAAVIARATIGGATTGCTITALFTGNPTNIADGVAATGFTLATTTPGVASNLNSSFFDFSTALDAVLYRVWYNVNGQGVAPAAGGRTLLPVALSAGDNANAVALASRTAIALVALTTTISGATSHIIITNNVVGATTDAVDGSAATGFTFTISTAGVTSLLSILEGSLDAVLTSAGTGDYTLTFNQAFARVPVISVGVLTSATIHQISSVAVGSVRIKTFLANDGTTAKDADFHLIAQGDMYADQR